MKKRGQEGKKGIILWLSKHLSETIKIFSEAIEKRFESLTTEKLKLCASPRKMQKQNKHNKCKAINTHTKEKMILKYMKDIQSHSH